jgi:hypothetical protein
MYSRMHFFNFQKRSEAEFFWYFDFDMCFAACSGV